MEHVGKIIEAFRDLGPEIRLSRQKARRAESIELIRRQRDERKQELLFNSRPFLLCGLPIRKPQSGTLLHERRNGNFFLQVCGHPQFGLPYGQDRLVPIWVATKAVRLRSREIRFGAAAEILDELGLASDEFQRWLRYMNSEKHEIYVSMNALEPRARGRTKGDVAEVRHVYLDFDVKGDEAVRVLRTRDDLPTPNHLIESSPGKWQVVWRVEGFDANQAETLMRGMVQDLGADPAATDSSRVLRVPGFYNHKYSKPHFVRVQNLTEDVYTPSRFPEYPDDGRSTRMGHIGSTGHVRAVADGITQSERDWAYANRALARGDDPEEVIRAIENYRSDKPNPQYYARHTVEKALQSVERSSTSRLAEAVADPDR